MNNPFSGSGSGGGSGGGFASGGFDPSMFSGMAGILGGMFGNSGGPYEDAMEQYKKYMNMGRDAQNPFYNAGKGAIGGYQDWLSQMKDPSAFINKQMGNYSESPWAKYLQQNNNRAGTNVGSATGMTGSTPMMQQMQQNSNNIASGDMGNYMDRVMGVNNQYGAGMGHMMDMGANSANHLTDMYNQYGGRMGEGAYGRGAGQNQDFWNMLGGGANLAMMFL